MTDMLVRLYDLPPADRYARALAEAGVVVRAAMPYEREPLVAWVRESFGGAWAGECEAAFAQRPVACRIAVAAGSVVGFACHDVTCANFFGPMGVAESMRGKGIGCALLLACLHAMASRGYAYAIIGGVGNGDIYRKVAGAVEIAGSSPGIYRDRLARADTAERAASTNPSAR
jgi:GNAT superfamily N-acetyltransferase